MPSSQATTSAAILERAWRVIPGAVNSARRRTDTPISVARARGSRLWDADGREFLDFHAAYSAVVLGHSHPAVTAAVAKRIEDLVLVGIGATEGEVELAERLVRHIPCAEQALVVSSGSEATYNAIRLARAVTGREKVLKFDGCYHGGHDYVLKSAETDEDESGGILNAAAATVLTCRYNDLEGVEKLLRERGHEVAAIIVEPIAHNPNLFPQEGFLEGLRALASEYEALLIFDEVITGFRHGLGGYQEICGVTPDLTTVGKAMANGFPIAAVVGPQRLMGRYATNPDGNVFFAGTYNGNAVGVAAANATIELMETEPVHEHLFRLGGRMREGLAQIAHELGVQAVVAGYGSIYTLLFADRLPLAFEDLARVDVDAKLFVAFRNELIARGMIEMPVPFVRAQVTYSHTDEDVDRALEISRDALLAARDRVAV
ncbi:MAG TPA: aspartate aminotransferase family protein [Conexibacter sp.]|jgi:glutamate-1-semialdehyde 2,1-aminomutase|nr:aspartate aminotransferase family protein [Conexibacter sp.]